MHQYFVTGIDTNAGKTIVSAILTEALHADYWKPVQSGAMLDSDTDMVASLVSNTTSRFFPPAYSLSKPLSPHIAAFYDNVEIDLQAISTPPTSNHLVIEGAGGLMVPLNNKEFVIDIIAQTGAEVILVSRNYLGSINHTLLSAMALRQRNIPVRGIIFNGEPMDGTEEIILEHTGLKLLGRIYEEESFDKATILKYADQFRFLNDE